MGECMAKGHVLLLGLSNGAECCVHLFVLWLQKFVSTVPIMRGNSKQSTGISSSNHFIIHFVRFSFDKTHPLDLQPVNFGSGRIFLLLNNRFLRSGFKFILLHFVNLKRIFLSCRTDCFIPVFGYVMRLVLGGYYYIAKSESFFINECPDTINLWTMNSKELVFQ